VILKTQEEEALITETPTWTTYPTRSKACWSLYRHQYSWQERK